MKVTIDLEPESIDVLIVESLQEAIDNTEACEHEDDRAVLPALHSVLEYYMGAEPYQEWMGT